MTITQSERLILTKVSLSDAAFIRQLLNSHGWLKYIGDKGVRSTNDARAYIRERLIASYHDNGFGLYKMVLREEQKPIGLCGLVQRPYLKYPDIGFAILPEFEGRGYTFEACRAVLKHAQIQWEMKQMLAITTIANKKSQHLLEKLHLKLAGRVKAEKSVDCFLLFCTGNAGE